MFDAAAVRIMGGAEGNKIKLREKRTRRSGATTWAAGLGAGGGSESSREVGSGGFSGEKQRTGGLRLVQRTLTGFYWLLQRLWPACGPTQGPLQLKCPRSPFVQGTAGTHSFLSLSFERVCPRASSTSDRPVADKRTTISRCLQRIGKDRPLLIVLETSKCGWPRSVVHFPLACNLADTASYCSHLNRVLRVSRQI